VRTARVLSRLNSVKVAMVQRCRLGGWGLKKLESARTSLVGNDFEDSRADIPHRGMWDIAGPKILLFVIQCGAADLFACWICP